VSLNWQAIECSQCLQYIVSLLGEQTLDFLDGGGGTGEGLHRFGSSDSMSKKVTRL